MIEVEHTPIDGLKIIRPKVFEDSRGYFLETYSSEEFQKAGITAVFVQDNESFSSKNVLRGLHFQAPPFDQGKLVRVVKGAALDVAVDLRKGSKSYGQHFSVRLDDRNKLMFWIPSGFAHGFLALEDDSVFLYKCTNFYHKESERSLLWNDPDLHIDWGTNTPVISEKDAQAAAFKEFVTPFSNI